MDTIIFLSQRRYQHYHFETLDFLDGYRLVALLLKENLKEFPENLHSVFAKVYSVNGEDAPGEIASYTLNYLEACQIIEAELEQAGSPENIRLICSDEANLSLTAFLRDKYKIPGPSYASILPYRDKVLMKKMLNAKQVSAPNFVEIHKEELSKNPKAYYEKLVNQLKVPFIIKPIDGSASTLSVKINNEKTFINHLDTLLNANTLFEAESFIEGKLYHCDILIQNEQILFVDVCEYLFPNLEFANGKVLSSIPLQATDPLKETIIKFSKSAMQALGLEDGARHIEVFHTKDKQLYFLEAAMRPPGAIAIPFYEKNYGINLYALNLMIHCDLPLPALPQLTEPKCFWGNLPLITGTVKELTPLPIKSQHELVWTVKEGEVITKASASVREMSGYFYVYNVNYTQLKADFEALRSYSPYKT